MPHATIVAAAEVNADAAAAAVAEENVDNTAVPAKQEKADAAAASKRETAASVEVVEEVGNHRKKNGGRGVVDLILGRPMATL